MKIQSLTALFVLIATLAFGQGGGKYGATPEDSTTCVENLSVYKNPYMKNKQYKEAVVYWRKALAVCPKARKSLYTDGDKMYKAFIKEAKKAENLELMQLYVDTLLSLYDQRIQYFKQEGYVLGRKGSAMLKYRSKEPAKALPVLARSFELQGNKMEAGAIVSYYTAQYKIYRADKSDANKTALLELFTPLADACEFNIKNAEKEKTKEYYTKALANIEKLFSQVASCEDLVKLSTPKFEATPDDVQLLKNTLKLFDKKDCASEPLYLQMAKKLQELEPSGDAAYAIAQAEVKKENCNEAINYYKQAAEMLADDDPKKVKAYLNMSRCQVALKQPQAAVGSARKALAINPNLGDAYIVIGNSYSQATCGDNECTKRSKYWAAYDMYAKAKSVDPEVADKANQRMGAAKAQWPRKTDCFFHSINAGDTYTYKCWIGGTTTVRVNE